MVTHVGDENGQAAIAEEKPKLEIPSQPAPSTAPAEESKALPQDPAPVVTEKNFLKQELTILRTSSRRTHVHTSSLWTH